MVHANSAIDATLQGDVLVGRVIARLRKIDLENASPAKRDGLQELTRLAGDLSEDSLHGDSEIKRLRGLAEHLERPASNPDLRIFSDALTGALGRQHRIAIDLGNFLAFLDYREMREVPPSLGGGNPPPPLRSRGIDSPVFPYVAATPTAMPGNNPYARAGSPNRMASAAAADFENRSQQIRGDETTAANHSEAAVSGC